MRTMVSASLLYRAPFDALITYTAVLCFQTQTHSGYLVLNISKKLSSLLVYSCNPLTSEIQLREVQWKCPRNVVFLKDTLGLKVPRKSSATLGVG